MALGTTLLGSSAMARAGTSAKKRKVVVITSRRRGARDQETSRRPEGQENIPRLIVRTHSTAISLFTQVVNRGICWATSCHRASLVDREFTKL